MGAQVKLQVLAQRFTIDTKPYLAASRASFSATPSPIQSQRQSAMTTLLPGLTSPRRICHASTA
jgi:hypothetical protein